MRSAVALFAILCFTAAFADKVVLSSRLSTLLKTKTQALDAVDTVLSLLEDLRQAELNEQAKADQNNVSEEEEGLSTISQYTSIVEQNKIVADGCTDNRETVEGQLNDARNRIAWIDNRAADVNDNLAVFADARCRLNALFVSALREHVDALHAINYLREEFRLTLGITAEVQLDQIQDLTEKFRQYEHLFEAQAIQSFLSLSEEDGPTFEKSTDEVKTLPERILQLLGNLENTVNANIKSIEAHEIQAQFDYTNYVRSAEAELDELADERDDKERQADKLEVELEVAQDYESRCWAIYQASVRALDAAVADLENRREFYEDETERRTEELEILDDVIRIFKEKIGSLEGYLRDRINAAGGEDGEDGEDNEVSLQDWADAVDAAVDDGDAFDAEDDEDEDDEDEDEDEDSEWGTYEDEEDEEDEDEEEYESESDDEEGEAEEEWEEYWEEYDE